MFILEHLPTAIAIGSTMLALIGWYRERTRQAYAREREMSHLLNNVKQGHEALEQILEQLDAIERKQERMEILLLRDLTTHQPHQRSVNPTN